MSAAKRKIDSQSLVAAIVYIVLGTLLCLSIIGVNSLLNWIIGFSLIAAGAVLLGSAIYVYKRLMAGNGAFGGVLIAFGVYALLFGLDWTKLIALVLLVLGFAYLIDFILILARKGSQFLWASTLVIAIIAITFGFLLYFVAEMAQFAGLILGVILILYGILVFIAAAKKK